MGHIVIENLDDAVVERLTAEAVAADKTLSQVVREILIAATRPSRSELLKRMDAIRTMSPASDLDSTTLVRETRDRP